MRIDVVRLEVVKDKTVEYDKKQIKCPEDLAGLGFKFLDKADREMFLIVCLNTGNRINAVHVVSIGSLNSSLVHPREVYKLAILSNSAAIAFLHNHPSGNSKPSKEDIKLTRKLIDVGKFIGIQVIDHMIIADEEYYSFKEHNACKF